MPPSYFELNNSIVVISAIAILSAFFYTVFWPMLDKNQEQQSACSDAICPPDAEDNNGYVTCKYTAKDGSTSTVKCKFKG